MSAVEEIRQKLFNLADSEYADFQRKLMPTVPPESVIGVRTPALRQYARTLRNTTEAAEFLAALPHEYYEENNLHAYLIESMRDYDACLAALEAFLPHIDNWATCDSLSPKVFKRHLPELYEHILRWTAAEHTYTVRFGIEMLMSFYLEEAFSPEHPALVAAIDSEEYYVRMMAAWYFATALYKQPEAIMPYFEEKRLPKWTHNKAIQKSIESYRITPEQKAHLKELRIK